MRIGLLSVDGYTKRKKQWGAKIYPNLALGKIARYYKEKGHSVEWAEPYSIFNETPYDIIFASKVFNFSDDVDFVEYRFNELVKGGTGYDIHSMLPDEIDKLQPDYTMFPTIDSKTAYGFLTRGCPNRCGWCVVPKKEGTVVPYMDVDDIAIDGRVRLVLMDNNILAAGGYCIEQFNKIINKGYSVDFNQALDARLMTDEFAELMARIKWIDGVIRFGCDTKAQIEDCERAIQMLEKKGFHGTFFLYTMLHGNVSECYERINHWRQRNIEVRKTNSRRPVFPHAQPFRDTTKPNELPQWQKDMARWCNNRALFAAFDFMDFSPRKGFKCSEYFK